jgi:hypothetical protein
MAAYWWACKTCNTSLDFLSATGHKGISHYIWDVLIPSAWDQMLLLLPCKKCGLNTLQIAYDFPRSDKESVRVVHIVGLGPFDDYVPMLWETYPVPIESETWFDFKYVNGRSVWGLNKPAVFSSKDLRSIFALYQDKTGHSAFAL